MAFFSVFCVFQTSTSPSPSGRPQAIITNNIPIPRNEKETVNPRTGKVERVFVNLEAIYPDPENPHVEMSLEELRAFSRGWMDRDWSRQEKEPLKEISANVPYRDPPTHRYGEDGVDKSISTPLKEKLVIHNQSPQLEDPHGAEVNRDCKGSKSRRLKVREVKGETQTGEIGFPLHYDSITVLVDVTELIITHSQNQPGISDGTQNKTQTLIRTHHDPPYSSCHRRNIQYFQPAA